MEANMERAVRRTQRYQFEDGLVEIASGLVSLLLGALFLAEGLARPGSLPPSFSAVGLLVVVFGGGWLARLAVRAAKARITHPRTGCVVYRRPPARTKALGMIFGGVFGVLFGAGLALLIGRYGSVRTWMPVLQAVPISAFLLALGRNLGLPRLVAVAVASAGVGLLAAVAGSGASVGIGTYFTGLGLALVVSGAWGLHTYLSQTQPPAEDDGDE